MNWFHCMSDDLTIDLCGNTLQEHVATLVKNCNLLLAVEPHGRLGRASRLGLALPSGGLSYQCHCVRTHPTFGVGRLLPVESHLRHVAPVVRLDAILANVHAAA